MGMVYNERVCTTRIIIEVGVYWRPGKDKGVGSKSVLFVHLTINTNK